MKFDMSRAWDDATRLIGANRQVLLIVAGVFFFLPYAILMVVMGPQLAELEAANRNATDPQAAMTGVMAFYGSIWWIIALMSVVQTVGILGLLALLTDRSRPTVGEALQIGAKHFITYFATQIILSVVFVVLVMIPFAIGAGVSVGAGVLVGLLAFVVLLYLMTKFSLIPPVIAIEREMNPITAIGRSWKLTKGNSFRLFLFYFLLILALSVAAIVVSMVIGLPLALFGTEAALMGQAIVGGLLNAAWVTVLLSVLAATHRQLAGPSTDAVSETFD